MQLKNKFYFNKSLLFLIILFLFPLTKFIIEYNFFGLRFIDDTQGAYSYFQYIYNYFDNYFSFPLWLDYLDGGLPSSFIIQHETSLLSLVFIVLGNLFNINPYFAFIGMMLFYNTLFLFGLYLNLKTLTKKNEIFLLIAVIHLISFDILFHFQSLVLISFTPFTFYYIRKFFENYKLTKLKQLAVLNLFLFFNNIAYYNVLILVYFPLIVFVSFYFINLYQFGLKKIKINLNYFFNIKNIIWLFAFILTVIFFYLIIQFQLNEYSHNSANRSEDFQTTYQAFISFAGLPLTKLINWFFLETFLLISLNPGPAGVSLLVLSFFLINDKKTNKLWLVCITIIILSFYLSGSHKFYLLNNFFGKILYSLPLMGFVKGLFMTIILAKFYFLIIFALTLDKIIDNKISNKKIIFALILINLFYTEILFTLNYKAIDIYLWFPYLVGLNLFLISLIFIKKISPYKLIVIIFISTLPYYLLSFTTEEYYDKNNYNKIDYVNKDKELYTSFFCMKKEDINDLYKNYISDEIIPLSKHHQFFLNTEYKPCNVIKPQRLRGSKKNYDIYTKNALASFLDKGRNFNNKIMINNQEFYVSNYFLDEPENYKNFKIIKPSNFSFEILSNKIDTKISFSKNWKIKENENLNNFILYNKSGHLQIEKIGKKNKIELLYDSLILKLIIFLFFLISIIQLIYFIYEISKNVIQIRNNDK